jgi:hypothetical protein
MNYGSFLVDEVAVDDRLLANRTRSIHTDARTSGDRTLFENTIVTDISDC